MFTFSRILMVLYIYIVSSRGWVQSKSMPRELRFFASCFISCLFWSYVHVFKPDWVSRMYTWDIFHTPENTHASKHVSVSFIAPLRPTEKRREKRTFLLYRLLRSRNTTWWWAIFYEDRPNTFIMCLLHPQIKIHTSYNYRIYGKKVDKED